MSTLFVFLCLVLFILGWYQVRGMHERAAGLCRHRLRKEGLQLLDESVAFSGFSLGKPIERCHCLQRRYQFDFTDNGAVRHSGQLWFCGKQAVFMLLEMQDGQRQWISLRPDRNHNDSGNSPPRLSP